MPWGTPEKAFTEVEQVPFRTAFCEQSVKKFICAPFHAHHTNGVYTSISGVERCQILLQNPLRLSQFVHLCHSCVSGHVLGKLTGSHMSNCDGIRAGGDGEFHLFQGVS